MQYYPLFLDIANRRCVVVGGGDVAERKVDRLLDFGASVVVVGKKLAPGLEASKKAGRITHIPADYDKVFIEGAFLVIGATDQDIVNERVARDAREKGILVNIVDDPERCDFILPALVAQGDLLIAVSTGGKSPALAKKLREDLEPLFGKEYQVLLDVMGQLREKLLKRGRSSDENRRSFEAVVHSDILKHIKDRSWEKVRKIVADITGEQINVGD